MNPASGAAGSIGIPPLNLSQGPSTALAQSDGENSIGSHTGDFVFKGKGRAGEGLSLSNMTPLLALAGIGGAVWLIYKKFA